jgi:hypothetical protein
MKEQIVLGVLILGLISTGWVASHQPVEKNTLPTNITVEYKYTQAQIELGKCGKVTNDLYACYYKDGRVEVVR